MLNYSLLIALVIGIAFFMANGLGEMTKVNFEKVNSAISVIEDINYNKGR